MDSKNQYRRRAIQILLLPSYVMLAGFLLDRLIGLSAVPWAGYVLMAAFYSAGLIALSLTLLAILRMKRSAGRRMLYMILAICLFIPYMLIPIGIYLGLSLLLGVPGDW